MSSRFTQFSIFMFWICLLLNGIPLHAQEGIKHGTAPAFPVMASQDALDKIDQFLLSEQPDFGDATTVSELAFELAEYVPCLVDENELEIIGIDVNETIKLPEHLPHVSICARLEHALDPIDLTVQRRAGILRITTQEAADAKPEIRVYDISDFVGEPRSVKRTQRINELLRTLYAHVAADDWLINGGTNDITYLTRDSRTLFVISSPTLTQYQVLSLLSKMRKLAPSGPSKHSSLARSALLRRDER